MIHNLTEAFPYVTGAAVTLAASAAALDVSIWVQAGMAGVVVLLLLKFFPMILSHMEAKDKRHEQKMDEKDLRFEQTIRDIVERNDKKDEAWQQIVQSRGNCPMAEAASEQE